MKILVTGGAGFIGSNLIEKLLNYGYKIICLDNFNEFYNPKIKKTNIKKFLNNKNFELYNFDIKNRDKIFKIFKNKSFDKIIHLAAQPGIRYSFEYPTICFDININGTMNVLDLAIQKKVKSFIFASSSSVYGISKKIPFSEKNELNPISPYGISKKDGESLCLMYNHLYKLPITVLRFFTVYGPNQRPDMAIYKFTKKITNKEEINLYEKGSVKRDYTYISDIIDGIVNSLNKNYNFEIFNLGCARPVELLNLVSLIEKNLKKKAKIKFKKLPIGDAEITHADIKKSGKMLNYYPKVKIEEGIEKFVKWYKKYA